MLQRIDARLSTRDSRRSVGDLSGAAIAALALAGLVALRLRQTQGAVAYFVFGAVLWIGFLYAGLHPVLAGVIVGVLMPDAAAGRLETTLHPWVALGLMPLFALANAGVSFAGLDLGSDVSLMLAGGIALALFAASQLGSLRPSRLPSALDGVSCRPALRGAVSCWSAAWVASVSRCRYSSRRLAFSESLLAAAKLGVLVASLLAGTTAWLIGYWRIDWFQIKPDRSAGSAPEP